MHRRAISHSGRASASPAHVPLPKRQNRPCRTAPAFGLIARRPGVEPTHGQTTPRSSWPSQAPCQHFATDALPHSAARHDGTGSSESSRAWPARKRESCDKWVGTSAFTLRWWGNADALACRRRLAGGCATPVCLISYMPASRRLIVSRAGADGGEQERKCEQARDDAINTWATSLICQGHISPSAILQSS